MIGSRSNATVKAIRALRSRRRRQESSLFLVEGIRPAIEVANAGVPVETVIVAPDLLHSVVAWQAADRMVASGARLLDVTADVFRSLSERDGPQGIAVAGHQRWERLEEIDPRADLQWIALAGVQDPGNLGTIVRTCDGAGGAGVILLGDATDPYDPAALRAAMGATFSQRLVRADFGALCRWCAHHGVQLVGTSDRGATPYREATYHRPVCSLMGSEREGLGEEELAACDVVARIPMAGRADSLNVAVAAGLMLYEVWVRLHQEAENLG